MKYVGNDIEYTLCRNPKIANQTVTSAYNTFITNVNNPCNSEQNTNLVTQNKFAILL